MAASAPDQAITPEPVMQALQGYQVSGILKAGIELGVFDQLAEGQTEPSAIASSIDADERGTRILLDALAAVGLLEPDGDSYRLTPVADAFLVRERPSYLGGMANILGSDWEWDGFRRLGDAVRRGGTLLEEHAEEPGHSWWETFARSIGGMATPAAEALAQFLAPWAEKRQPLDVLDLACGNGKYSATLATANEHARITLLDWPNVLEITRGFIAEAGLAERASYIEGNMFEVPLDGPYDLVIASHVFHHFSEERCVELLERLAKALKPNGRIAIQDFLAAGTAPAEEPFPRLFSVLMLVWTREGEAYPLETYERMLEATGFASPEVHQAPGSPSRFLVAERTG
jgi:ubiquinone/menaquinone biosynthesis C-methylase UbiE